MAEAGGLYKPLSALNEEPLGSRALAWLNRGVCARLLSFASAASAYPAPQDTAL